MKRGFLIQSLLLIALLLVFCLGLLGRQPFAYSGAKQTSKMLQARQLAVAGMEDVRVKLERDYQTRQLGEVKTVSYVEDVVSGSELSRLLSRDHQSRVAGAPVRVASDRMRRSAGQGPGAP